MTKLGYLLKQRLYFQVEVSLSFKSEANFKKGSRKEMEEMLPAKVYPFSYSSTERAAMIKCYFYALSVVYTKLCPSIYRDLPGLKSSYTTTKHRNFTNCIPEHSS